MKFLIIVGQVCAVLIAYEAGRMRGVCPWGDFLLQIVAFLAILATNCIASGGNADERRMRQENARLRDWLGLNECGNCRTCGDEGEPDPDCPFAGEPDGCNNRSCREYVIKYGREATGDGR
ncbi:MAG: hypothetical protein IIW14_03785 [Kiritimatiellae bacterium]|nr:hypothetical protein [Kiritimatiellia bacterium]